MIKSAEELRTVIELASDYIGDGIPRYPISCFRGIMVWGISMLSEDEFECLLRDERCGGHTFEPIKLYIVIEGTGAEESLSFVVLTRAQDGDGDRKEMNKIFTLCKVKDIPKEVMPMFDRMFVDTECYKMSVMGEEVRVSHGVGILDVEVMPKVMHEYIKLFRKLRGLHNSKRYKKELKKFNELFISGEWSDGY